jgi:hypothetical protein
VFLTAEGRRVQRRAAKESESILAALLNCVGESDHGTIEQFLRNVHQAFSKAPSGANGRPKVNASKREKST